MNYIYHSRHTHCIKNIGRVKDFVNDLGLPAMSPNIKFGVSILKINTKHYIWLSYKRKVRANPLPYFSYNQRCKQFKKTQINQNVSI